MRIRIFTDRPGQGETGHAHLSNTRQLPSMGRSVIPRYSAAQKRKPANCAKNHHFSCVHEQNADFSFRTGKSHPQFEPQSRTGGGHGPGGIWQVGPSSILSMADSEAALKSRPCVAFVIRSALVCLETGNPWVTTKGTDTKAASKSRRWVAFSSGRSWFAWRQGQPVDGDERN